MPRSTRTVCPFARRADALRARAAAPARFAINAETCRGQNVSGRIVAAWLASSGRSQRRAVHAPQSVSSSGANDDPWQHVPARACCVNVVEGLARVPHPPRVVVERRSNVAMLRVPGALGTRQHAHHRSALGPKHPVVKRQRTERQCDASQGEETYLGAVNYRRVTVQPVPCSAIPVRSLRSPHKTQPILPYTI